MLLTTLFIILVIDKLIPLNMKKWIIILKKSKIELLPLENLKDAKYVGWIGSNCIKFDQIIPFLCKDTNKILVNMISQNMNLKD